MSKAIKAKLHLAVLLDRYHGEIVAEWLISAQSLPWILERRFSDVEIQGWINRALDAIIETLTSDKVELLDEHIHALTTVLWQNGKGDLGIIELFLLSRESISPILVRTFPPDSMVDFELFNQLDVTIREIISWINHLYIETLELNQFQEHQRLIVESESLQRTTTALLQKLTLDEILEIVCLEAQRLTGATGSAVLLREEGQGWLRVVISTGKPLPAIERLPIDNSIAGLAVKQKKPWWTNEPTDHVQAYLRNPNLKALLVIPLETRDTIIGVLDVVNKPGGFTDEDIHIMGLFAAQAAIAIENARLYEQAEKLAVIEERHRLARELHDSVTQLVFSATIHADVAYRSLISEERDAAIEYLQELRQIIREVMLNMRLLIFELHPPVLEREGLVVAIKTRLESVESRSGIKTELHVEGERRLPISVEQEVYRITQEALTNVVKHANAQKVKIWMKFSDQSICIDIEDDGVGFNPLTVNQQIGFGLRSMQERVAHINGKITVDSSPGKGTKLMVKIPV